ncbi:hypothetical protein CCYN2B_50085 [Capnocytophaga cynodegmi]|uniref:Uncharacterized protein n=1 Tax=Capnocytophaga cynodegmi TaxID=28189 RepID=A0A0B7HH38_9FLAO|nr:hypothetical protein CCYN2B_50085 [Capnocytophaga cynodegmi]
MKKSLSFKNKQRPKSVDFSRCFLSFYFFEGNTIKNKIKSCFLYGH